MEKTVTLLGREVSVAFNMAAQIAYEDIMDKPFDPADLARAKSRMALCAAALTSSRGAEALPDGFVAALLHDAPAADIRRLSEAVAECMEDFLHEGALASPEEAAADGGGKK